MEKRVIVVTGCTASGKGAVARALARELNAEIVSVDSMKVYRRMDIGTAKPGPSERAETPHHLVDVVDSWEPFSSARFVELAEAAIDAAHARGRPIVAVGGTVLYLKCLYEGMFEGPSADPAFRASLRARAEREGVEKLHAELATVDPAAAERIHQNDIRRIERALEVHHLTGRSITSLQQQWGEARPRRPDWNWRWLGLRREKSEASRRINARVLRMIDQGLEAEARAIWEDPRGVSDQARQAVGYAEWFDFFRRGGSRADVVERIKINSRHLAKHQRTWLRRFTQVRWVDLAEGQADTDILPQARAALGD